MSVRKHWTVGDGPPEVKDGPAPDGWETILTTGEVNSVDFGVCKAPTITPPMCCPNCGSGNIGSRYIYRAGDSTENPDGTHTYQLRPDRDPDAVTCGDCDFEALTDEPFVRAALEHMRSQEPPAPKPPRLRRLRETVALWLAPWITDWDDEGW